MASTVLAVVAPIALLLWIHGLLRCRDPAGRDPHPALTRQPCRARRLRGVGAVLALMWLLARIGRSTSRSRFPHARKTDPTICCCRSRRSVRPPPRCSPSFSARRRLPFPSRCNPVPQRREHGADRHSPTSCISWSMPLPSSYCVAIASTCRTIAKRAQSTPVPC